jgi:hypothetical protein
VRRDGNRGVSLFPPGTPIITQKQSGYRSTTFAWRAPDGFAPSGYQVWRATDASSPYQQITVVPPTVCSFTDSGLTDGWQYLYEVRAIYAAQVVPSAPFAILVLFNNNLIANSGFEENADSHWDKWFTGDIPWQNMTTSTNQPFQGKQCMEVKLVNEGDNSSIKQANQYGIPDPAIRTTPGALYSFGGWFRSGGISQPSQHWLEWNTTRTGDNTNDIPPLPWPLYFTPPLNLGTDPTPWTYVNRVFIMPDGFPSVELRHRFTIDSPGSGSIFMDNIFFRQLPPPDDPSWQQLLPFGSTWSYAVDTPPDNWFAADFNDGAWPQAPAKFGAGTGTSGIVTPLPWMHPAYYFRRSFSAPNAPLQELLLAATATDDYNGQTYPLRVFINGQEIVSSGIETVSGDGTAVKYFDLLPFANLLHPGPNLIAVMVQNAWASDWDNVAFDLSLRAVPAPPTSPTLASARFSSIRVNSDGSIQLRITGPAQTALQIQSAGAANGAGSWQMVQSVVTDGSGAAEVTDPSASFSPNTQSKARFYRLIGSRTE